MGNLEVKQDDSIIKTMGIAFPQGKILVVVQGAFFKMKVPSIDATQFSNLSMISKIYNHYVEIKRSADHLVIYLTEIDPELTEAMKEEENEL